jgi:integrase/recombinase XerD
MTTTPTTEVAVVEPEFSDPERYALAAFLAGYRGLTRDAYALDLRQVVAWCNEHNRRLFGVRRADIGCFARDLEAHGRARATVARRLCTVAGFFRYAEQEGPLERSPAAHVRRPRLDYESHATGLDCNEVGALLVAAGLASASEHALVSLLAVNGLRVSEGLGADIEALGLERGHRTLTVLRKGGKVVTIPLAPRTARAIDLAIGERVEGQIFLGRNDERLDRHAAWRIVRRLARKAGINKQVGPHTLRHAFITAALDAGVPLRDVQEAASHADPRTTCVTTGPGCPSTGTPPTSWPHSSRPPGSRPADLMPLGSAMDPADIESGHVLEDPVAGHQLQTQRHRRGRDPPVGLVDLLRKRMAARLCSTRREAHRLISTSLV